MTKEGVLGRGKKEQKVDFRSPPIKSTPITDQKKRIARRGPPCPIFFFPKKVRPRPKKKRRKKARGVKNPPFLAFFFSFFFLFFPDQNPRNIFYAILLDDFKPFFCLVYPSEMGLFSSMIISLLRLLWVKLMPFLLTQHK